MKKVLFISALFLAIASTVYAQTPRTPDPQQQTMIRNAQSSYMKSTNNKDKPRLKPTDLDKVSKQNDQDMKDLKEQEKVNRTSTSKPQVRKQNTDNSREQKNMKRMREQQKKDKRDSKRRSRENNVKAAERKLAYAQSAKEDAMRAFTELLDRQKKEMAALQERHNAEAAAGLTEVMSKRHEQEVQALSAEHAKQLMDAQQAVDEASRNYEKALDLCDDARKAAL